MMHNPDKDNKSHRTSRQSTKVVIQPNLRLKKPVMANNSMDFSSMQFPSSPTKKATKPTMLRDFVNNPMVLKNDKVI